MALSNFKDIITNKAYLINSKDREIFEKGDYQSFFGLSKTDAIEFIMYDVNNNQLPQQSADNQLVRYVPLTNTNIKDYFLIASNTVLQKNKLPAEYFIDAERLIKEAGYNNGIFKTQITLVNHRAGSNKPYDKLWIQEISPSRKEIRLQPLAKGVEVNVELKKRYDIFVYDNNFREDTQPFIDSFLAKIKPEDISTVITNKYTSTWFTRMKTEYTLSNFSTFVTNTHAKFLEACKFEFSNKESNVTSPDYGKPKTTQPSLDLSKKTILDICTRILIQILDSTMLKPKVNSTLNATEAFSPSADPVSKVLQRVKSDTIIDTTSPVVELATLSKSTTKEVTITTTTPDGDNDKKQTHFSARICIFGTDKEASKACNSGISLPVFTITGQITPGLVAYNDKFGKSPISGYYWIVNPVNTEILAINADGLIQRTSGGFCNNNSGGGGDGGGNRGGGGSTVCMTYVNTNSFTWVGDYTDCDGNFVSSARLEPYASICAIRGSVGGVALTESGPCYPTGGGGGGNKGGGGGGNTGGGGGNGGGGGGRGGEDGNQNFN